MRLFVEITEIATSNLHNSNLILKRAVSLIAVCCLAPFCIGWRFQDNGQTLQADRVIKLPEASWYAWIDKDNLLVFKLDKVACRLNISTNITTPLPYLTTAMHKSTDRWPVTLSPVGKVLVVDETTFGGVSKYVFIQLDGGSPEREIKSESNPCAWLDATTFVSLDGDYPKAMRLNKYTTLGATYHVRSVDAVTGPAFSVAHPLLGVTHGHAIGISTEYFSNPKSELTLFDIHMGDNSPAKTTTFALPEKARVVGMSLSPDGNRIAWLLTTKPEYKADPLIRPDRKSGQLAEKSVSAGVWISSAKGETFRCLGQMELAAGEMGLSSDCLQWTKDGSRLSLYYKRNLYMLKAPQ